MQTHTSEAEFQDPPPVTYRHALASHFTHATTQTSYVQGPKTVTACASQLAQVPGVISQQAENQGQLLTAQPSCRSAAWEMLTEEGALGGRGQRCPQTPAKALCAPAAED